MEPASEIYGSEGKTEAKSWGHKLINILTRKSNRFAEIVAVSMRYLITKSGIKESAVPNMLSI